MLGRSHLYSNGQLIHRFEAKNNALSLGDVSAYFDKRDLWVVALNVSVYDFWGASKTGVANIYKYFMKKSGYIILFV